MKVRPHRGRVISSLAVVTKLMQWFEVKTPLRTIQESGLIHLIGHLSIQQYFYCLSTFWRRDDQRHELAFPKLALQRCVSLCVNLELEVWPSIHWPSRKEQQPLAVIIALHEHVLQRNPRLVRDLIAAWIIANLTAAVRRTPPHRKSR